MNALQQAIDSILKEIDIQNLISASHKLTTHYREGLSLFSEEELLAYLIVRCPATYAAISHVLSQVEPGSILDMGAGPGTVWWAANASWKGAYPVTAVERVVQFIELGKKLGSQVTWIQSDIFNIPSFENHDWIIFSYSVGELQSKDLLSVLGRCWQAARKGVIVIEPGTPQGWQKTLFVRDYLIEQGGFVLAPCPHVRPCPLQKPDWCHFSVRLERSFLHRKAKLATLAYEDEKFSYVAITKKEPREAIFRVIRPPMRRGGHVILPLCTPDGLQNTTISRAQKQLYKKARKSSWNDPW